MVQADKQRMVMGHGYMDLSGYLRPMTSDLSHISSSGLAQMVDISQKQPTARKAVAQARVYLPAEVLAHLHQNEIHISKGAVFHTAIIAGVMAAKKTSELIPLCHPLQLDNVHVSITMEGEEAVIIAEASVIAKTGVEMEALTAAGVAALTVYDMCKALSHEIRITEIKLLSKTGGKNDYRRNT